MGAILSPGAAAELAIIPDMVEDGIMEPVIMLELIIPELIIDELIMPEPIIEVSMAELAIIVGDILDTIIVSLMSEDIMVSVIMSEDIIELWSAAAARAVRVETITAMKRMLDF